MLELGKEKPQYNLKILLEKFSEYSESALRDWAKAIYGVKLSDFFIQGGAIMDEQQKAKYREQLVEELDRRYKGKPGEPHYQALKKNNPDIDFSLIMDWANTFAPVDDDDDDDDGGGYGWFDMDDYLKFLKQRGWLKNAVEDESELLMLWYLSSVGMKESLEVELLNGAVNKYRTRKQVVEGNLVVVGRGFKSSGEMGRVKEILSLDSTKAWNTALAYYSFSKDSSAEELKKSATEAASKSSF